MKKRPFYELTEAERAERRIQLYVFYANGGIKEDRQKAWDKREAVFQLRHAGETWKHIGQSIGVSGTRAQQMFKQRERLLSRGYRRPE